TWQPKRVMHNLVHYIEQGEIRPLVAKTYPLSAITTAQQDFLAKNFIGKIVLLPSREQSHENH
ncbi:MAG: zinc-binding dehydrogenase, partial [Thiothrix sp.]|nr:zinc-binding dehydrogenase [Thiothrix sp.]